MNIQKIGLADITDRIVMSSANINDASVLERKNKIFNTASYYIFAINKPAFSIELADEIDGLKYSPARDNAPLSG